MSRILHTHRFIQSIEAKAIRKRSLTVRIADDLTEFFGSIPFLVINVLVFGLWITINLGLIPGVNQFDPFPFPLMTTAVSLEAIVLAIIVLMSQNRQSLISSLREEVDMNVNLIAEQEITMALKLLHLLLEKKGIKVRDTELHEMLQDIDTSYIERQLEKQLSFKQPSIVEEVAKPITDPIEAVKNAVTEEVKKINS